MDFQTTAAIVFAVLLAVLLYFNRKKLDTKFLVPYFIYFSMYKTRVGLGLMDSAAKKFRKTAVYIGYFGIFVGFLGMAFIAFGLIKNIFTFFAKPQAAQGVGLVLPFPGKGIFYVPFFYWIISIFVILIVHEFAHGLIARAHNIRVKSSGLAFVGIIIPLLPGAFVETDEKQSQKRPHSQQLSIFAAGPLANMITAFVFLALALLVLAPILNAAIEPNGVKVADFVKGNFTYPAENSGIKIGESIQQIDGIETPYTDNLSRALHSKKPGDVVAIKTDKSDYQVKLAKNPDNESLAYMGAYLEQDTKIKDSVKSVYGEFLPNAAEWFFVLFITLFTLNLGIGLFNLVPIGPLDGGRMLLLPLQKYFGEETGKKIWVYVGLIFLIIIAINIGAPFGLLNFLKLK